MEYDAVGLDQLIVLACARNGIGIAQFFAQCGNECMRPSMGASAVPEGEKVPGRR